jgi:tryptophan 2,3-dioxygenase
MDKPTLKDVLDDWLYRTPIQGSTPSQVDDADNVKNFLEAYLRAYVEQLQCARSYALSTAPTQADRERLDQRYSKEEELARGFLFALEIPEPERIRVSRIRAAIVFIESYRELPLLAWPREVLDAMVALEQSFVIFRQRHARMVERIIGRRPGTGGSAGVDYLDQTALRYRIFRDVWAVRTLLVQGRALPTLEQPEVYGFAEK